MKLLYSGPAPLDPNHVRRQKRRATILAHCWEFLGTIALLTGIWALIILMFVM